MKNWALILFLFFAGIRFGPAQDLQALSFPQLQESNAIQPRHTVVFLYTDWCRYCAAMEQTTFKDKTLLELLGEQFYFVSFNGESKEEVAFLGRSFKYKASGVNTGAHQLAEQLGTMDGQLTYPATVVLGPDYQIVFRHNAFLSAKQLREILEAVVD